MPLSSVSLSIAPLAYVTIFPSLSIKNVAGIDETEYSIEAENSVS